MVSAFSLWAPILLSALLVFVASSLIHMVLNWHKNDLQGVPDEDGLMDALRGFDLPPGNYLVPRAESREVAVFKIASTTAFMGYALAHAQDAIWMSQGWPATFRSMLDGLIYALLTGGAFGWLWP